MILTRTDDAVTVRCPAKVNLFLELHARRPDGFHEIETVMQAVTLYDGLTLERRPAGIELTCSDPSLPAGPDNLAWRAAELLDLPAGVSIRLDKRIPAGAGLGGGSSNAAGVLAGLNALFGLGLGRPALTRLAARLGSDVAFFIWGGTALCTGRGEHVTPVPSPALLHYVIACPPASVSTAEAYHRAEELALTTGDRSASLMLECLAQGRVDSVPAQAFNRLDRAAVSLAPDVDRAKRLLSQAAAAPAFVSGSGSAVFAVLPDATTAADAAQRAAAQRIGRVFAARTELPGV